MSTATTIDDNYGTRAGTTNSNNNSNSGGQQQQPAVMIRNSTGLPDLLPVRPRQQQTRTVAVQQEPAGYILVPASAIGGIQQPIVTASAVTNLRLVPALTAGPNMNATIFVVGSSSASSSYSCKNSQLPTFREHCTISGSHNNYNGHFVDGGNGGSGCFVDNASLRQSMGRNRESLKRKLLQRRSARELVEQGILPPPKTPPSFYEQRIKLERAKMSDILKHKIEHRPDKQKLVSQHILLDSHADPGIAEKQQQLKKCKLADSLNEKLANRPGPLELVQENILHVDAALEQAIKDGRLQFKPTSAGLVQKHPQPVFVVTQEETTPCSNTSTPDHHRSGGGGDNASLDSVHSVVEMTATAVAVADSRNFTTTTSSSTKSKPKKIKSKTTRVLGANGGGIVKNTVAAGGSKAGASSSKLTRFVGGDSRETAPVSSDSNNNNNGTGCGDFLGGIAAAKRSLDGSGIVGENPIQTAAGFAGNFASSADNVEGGGNGQQTNNKTQQETSYDLLLQQQQLLLQWQYELQQKYPNSSVQLVSLSSSKMAAAAAALDQQKQRFTTSGGDRLTATTTTTNALSSVQSSPGAAGHFGGGYCGVGGGCGESTSPEQAPTPLARSESDGCTATNAAAVMMNKPIRRLEDMKVQDLKAECKKRNLPVSGSKSNIVDRLKSYEDVIVAAHRQQQQQQQQHSDCLVSSNPNSPCCPASAAAAGGSQRCGTTTALPPIAFLCSSASGGCNNNAPYQQQDGGPQMTMNQQHNVASSIYPNRSSSSSDFASNYSSPGIDLSSLNFGNGCVPPCSNGGGGEEFCDNNNSDTTTTTTRSMEQCTTFAGPDFGAQFLVTPGCGGEMTTTAAMDTGDVCGGQNAPGHTAMYQQQQPLSVSDSRPFDASSVLSGGSPASSLNGHQQQFQHHHQRLPFLQAANTLAVHEEVLRQQQKKIEEVQKQIQKSQELLRQQQQMILAAKQMQTEANEGGASEAECILNQLDTKQIQKAHIQLFLQQKIQQQQLQQQINVQQELIEIQQKLQEEMAVHQALNDVVRVLREEPRVSVLVLHLLRRYQIQQQEQQQQESELSGVGGGGGGSNSSNSAAADLSEGQNNNSTGDGQSQPPSAAAAAAAMLYDSSPSLSTASPPKSSQQQQCDNGQQEMDYSAGAEDNFTTTTKRATSKNRQGSGQHNNTTKKISQASIFRANSVPTSPAKSKSTSSMGDMEEIFRTVLDHASKATTTTEKSNASESNQQQTVSAIGSLPSFDQLIQPSSRPVSEIETAISITNGNGISMTTSSCHSGSEQQPQLGPINHHPPPPRRTTTAAGAAKTNSAAANSTALVVNGTSSFMYTRNDHFDDLMEVIRNNDGPMLGASQEDIDDAATATTYPPNYGGEKNKLMHQHHGNSNNGFAAMMQSEKVHSQQQQQQQLNLSAYGPQEVADLLGTEWFNVQSILPASSSCHTSSNRNGQIAAFNAVPASASGRKNDCKTDQEPTNTNNTDPIVASNCGQQVLSSSDMNEQMDWFDLILPSPSSAAGGVLHELPVMNCLPMDTDCGGSMMTMMGAKIGAFGCDDDTNGRNSLLSTAATNTHNPVLSMSACVSNEAM